MSKKNKIEKSWFSAKGLFKHIHKNSSIRDRYEESIIIIKAISEKEADQKAIKIFEEHGDEEIGIRFTGIYEICELLDPVRNGKEVYWFLRISNLSPEKYVEKYWNSGKPKSCDDKGWTHFWHNLDGKNSGCINCYEVRKGQLWKEPNKPQKRTTRKRQQ